MLTPLRRKRQKRQMGRPGQTGTKRSARAALALCSAGALLLTAAGCGTDDGEADSGSPPPVTVKLPSLKGKHLEVTAVWTGTEQKNFTKVLKEFEKRTGATVSFVPSGDDMAGFVGSKMAGGQPPDVALVGQVGVLREFAQKGWAKPVNAATKAELSKNFSKGWQELGAYKGKQYGVYFKVSNKSLIWYNTSAFEYAGAREAKTWKDFLAQAQLISDSGTDPVSVGGADGWTLTDWFENVYLSQAGPEKYDLLAQHKIKWTDPSVTRALRTLAELWGTKGLLAGGRSGALQTAFPDSVVKAFANAAQPDAAMVFEGDFAAANVSDAGAKLGSEAKVFPFPKVGETAPVVTGGDVAVALKDSEASQALLTFLASPDAAHIWAQAGGFISANKKLSLSVYPNEPLRKIAKAVIDAGDNFRFDMSDQAPASFGGKPAQGEWKALQDFLKNPKDVEGIQRQLERDAAKAYGN
ncbi:putative sugar ABC transporter solute-binding protein [Streptomyces bingchenggensis BCW-1]|uniref:Putative sugar ABC transporter solute-binding protein n=1 Tax=Streptomyces bingchenggensis (strain BCW-1) TaxID=749414 RepID=D7BVR3_STRBB|nr:MULTISPECIES: extracellular solute-binding protein [Streptomyces]ADI09642.1 putative sugar ABC transporter solute-binding protein [Streptomyces bingchenggensis BCW-1]